MIWLVFYSSFALYFHIPFLCQQLVFISSFKLCYFIPYFIGESFILAFNLYFLVQCWHLIWMVLNCFVLFYFYIISFPIILLEHRVFWRFCSHSVFKINEFLLFILAHWVWMLLALQQAKTSLYLFLLVKLNGRIMVRSIIIDIRRL